MMKTKNYVIVRADRAGVFFGNLVSKEGSEVTLNECRKLFYWDGAAAIEQIALDGISPENVKDCKFTVTVENATILGVIQILPCTEKAVKSIQSVTVWKQ